MSSKPVSATIETPIGAADDFAVEEIPLPPPEKWGELDNEGEAEAAAPAQKPTEQAREIAKLDFVDGKPCRRVPLTYPFNYEGRGLVAEIIVRRLTVGEVGDLLDTRPKGMPDNFDIYGLMTGFPAAVLRGLVDVDGEEVAEACFDFLPRLFRPATAEPSSTRENGGA